MNHYTHTSGKSLTAVPGSFREHLLAADGAWSLADDDKFDPADFTVPEVTKYLETADDDERLRVLNAERAGSDRSGISSWSPPDE